MTRHDRTLFIRLSALGIAVTLAVLAADIAGSLGALQRSFYDRRLAFQRFAPAPTDALVRPETRARYRRLQWMGLTDAIRAVHPHGHVYTFWDYQAGAWQRDMGLRIDHALLSPTLAERLVAADPDRNERDQPQPSDHVPVVTELR